MRGPARTGLAILCALALFLPLISISDETSASPLDDAAMLVLGVVVAAAFVAVAHVHSVRGRAYAAAIATPSDPRSPPR